MSYEDLDGRGKLRLRKMVDAVVEMLREYADIMESGEIEMCTGPEALRQVALIINEELEVQELRLG